MERNGKYRVTERLYQDADGNIVREGDPKAVRLFATPGKLVPADDAVRKFAGKGKGRKPAANKGRKPAGDKGGG